MLLGLPGQRSSAAIDGASDPRYPALSLVDLSVFLHDLFIALAAQLPATTLISGLLVTIVYIVAFLPLEIVWSRLISSPYPFTPAPSLLQDVTIHLVRVAFVHFPHTIGRVFFDDKACLRLFVERTGGRARFAAHCRKVDVEGVRGWWIAPDHAQDEPSDYDVVLVYLHGGGGTMGSPAFYLQFLLSLAAELRQRGFTRPAVFAPYYSHAPERRFPTQLDEIDRAWRYAVGASGDAKIGIGGDSAGAGLATALMFKLSQDASASDKKPDFAALISPWASMLRPPSSRSRLRRSDFVSPAALQHFAHLYSSAQPRARNPGLFAFLLSFVFTRDSFDGDDVVGLHRAICLKHPLISPQDIETEDWWDRAVPDHVYVSYGAGEVLGPQCHALAQRMRESHRRRRKRSGVHEKVWPLAHAPEMVYCYLGRDERERGQGVKAMADFIAGACNS